MPIHKLLILIFNLKFKITKKGFTLLELLVVIAILAILAGVGIVSYDNAQMRARDTKRKKDHEAIKSALELYRQNNSSGGFNFPNGIGGLAPTYIESIPKDPKDNIDYYYFGRPIGCTLNCTDYRLLAKFENTNNPEIMESQSKCPNTGIFSDLTYYSDTYVTCPLY